MALDSECKHKRRLVFDFCFFCSFGANTCFDAYQQYNRLTEITRNNKEYTPCLLIEAP